MKRLIATFYILALSAMSAFAQSGVTLTPGPWHLVTTHAFFDKTNLELQGVNVATETASLFAIQSHDDGGGIAACANAPCWGALAARGRTLDPFEKHFQSYGYGWGAVYDYGGGVGLNMLVAYAFHATGHHKLERWVPVIAIGHAAASTGYALTGSGQGVKESVGW